ncbi:hypothetical protein AVEN_100377-1 [Araneus ventricosus]|uniref:Uncharacterized protein n=1 Tax=Araneus ventricosus TaxID=182803 RepID=A0A4Y2L8L5_ARAVE|nr:hypothetical protein AVEN_100377-1 [Araneus ventricosus]
MAYFDCPCWKSKLNILRIVICGISLVILHVRIMICLTEICDWLESSFSNPYTRRVPVPPASPPRRRKRLPATFRHLPRLLLGTQVYEVPAGVPLTKLSINFSQYTFLA